jgi:2'-5' RNA ligase
MIRDACISLDMLMNKYFIAILPDFKLASEIISFRRKYMTGLNEKDEHKKFPHITLQHTFSKTPEIEEALRPFLLSLAERRHRFEINLSGFGQFNHRVIFIEVVENPALVQLYQEIKQILLTKMDFASNEVSVKYHPHITLEKKIKSADFNFYWEKIEDQKFNGEFLCNSFSLMRHNGRVWEEIEKFVFTQ